MYVSNVEGPIYVTKDKKWVFQIPFICIWYYMQHVAIEICIRLDPMEKHRAYEVSYLYIFEFMTFWSSMIATLINIELF